MFFSSLREKMGRNRIPDVKEIIEKKKENEGENKPK